MRTKWHCQIMDINSLVDYFLVYVYRWMKELPCNDRHCVTCNSIQHRIGHVRYTQDLSSCKNICDQTEQCRFFFVYEYNYCELFSSCNHKDYHSPSFAGHTYEKLHGKYHYTYSYMSHVWIFIKTHLINVCLISNKSFLQKRRPRKRR